MPRFLKPTLLPNKSSHRFPITAGSAPALRLASKGNHTQLLDERDARGGGAAGRAGVSFRSSWKSPGRGAPPRGDQSRSQQAHRAARLRGAGAAGLATAFRAPPAPPGGTAGQVRPWALTPAGASSATGSAGREHVRPQTAALWSVCILPETLLPRSPSLLLCRRLLPSAGAGPCRVFRSSALGAASRRPPRSSPQPPPGGAPTPATSATSRHPHLCGQVRFSDSRLARLSTDYPKTEHGVKKYTGPLF